MRDVAGKGLGRMVAEKHLNYKFLGEQTFFFFISFSLIYENSFPTTVKMKIRKNSYKTQVLNSIYYFKYSNILVWRRVGFNLYLNELRVDGMVYICWSISAYQPSEDCVFEVETVYKYTFRYLCLCRWLMENLKKGVIA